MTAQTPVYGIKYPVQGEPIRTTRQILEDNANTVEAALVRGGIAPPNAADLAALAGRVTVLEAVQPGVQVYRTAAWSAFGPGVTRPSFDTVDWQRTPAGLNPIWSATTPSRFTAPKAGLYHVVATFTWQASQAAGIAGGTHIRVNGGAVQYRGNASGMQAVAWAEQTTTADIYLTAGQYVEMECELIGGSVTPPLDVPGRSARMAMRYIGA